MFLILASLLIVNFMHIDLPQISFLYFSFVALNVSLSSTEITPIVQ
jgi:hypothetical protein